MEDKRHFYRQFSLSLSKKKKCVFSNNIDVITDELPYVHPHESATAIAVD
jgi:hypothetical protein